MAAQQTLYIVYNADASIMGKLKYGYRKITCPEDAEAECAACEITHGGLSLKETPAWVETKKEIEASNVKIVQWHRDELSPSVKSYIQENKIPYPMALLEKNGQLEILMNKSELGKLKGDATAFQNELKTRGVLSKL